MDETVRTTEITGIFQADVIIRTALIQAFRDLRGPDITHLDLAFASLAKDPLTREIYGEKEIAAAREWFLNNEIEVFEDIKVPDGARPLAAITIAYMNSNETENTLGDVAVFPTESIDNGRPVYTRRFDPVEYDAVTGAMTVPDDIAESVALAEGMFIVDKAGREFAIKEVFDYNLIGLTPGTLVDFNNCVLRAPPQSFVREVEGGGFSETYSLGIHVANEPNQLTYLHSIVVYALLHYREKYLEARGFQRSVIGSSEKRRDDGMGSENYFSRFMTLTGVVYNTWGKSTVDKIQVVDTQLRVLNEGTADLSKPDDLLWIGELDSFNTRFR